MNLEFDRSQEFTFSFLNKEWGMLQKYSKYILGLILVFSLNGHSKNYNLDVVDLPEGKTVEVDVAHFPKFVTLQVIAPMSENPQEPQVEVINENGFECLYDTYLAGYETDFDPMTNKSYFKGVWEILIEWSPGADLSGCTIKVNMPERQESTAHIYMND